MVTVVINVDQQLTPVPSDSSSGSGSSSNSGTTNSGDSTVTDTTPAAVDTTVLAASTQGSEAGGNPQSNADAAVGNAVDAGGTTTTESLLAGAAIVEPTELQKSSGPDIRLENARFRLEVANLENVRFRSEGALGSGLHFSEYAWRGLDSLDQTSTHKGWSGNLMVGTSVVATSGMTIGVILWTVRAGYLVALVSSGIHRGPVSTRSQCSIKMRCAGDSDYRMMILQALRTSPKAMNRVARPELAKGVVQPRTESDHKSSKNTKAVTLFIE